MRSWMHLIISNSSEMWSFADCQQFCNLKCINILHHKELLTICAKPSFVCLTFINVLARVQNTKSKESAEPSNGVFLFLRQWKMSVTQHVLRFFYQTVLHCVFAHLNLESPTPREMLELQVLNRCQNCSSNQNDTRSTWRLAPLIIQAYSISSKFFSSPAKRDSIITFSSE